MAAVRFRAANWSDHALEASYATVQPAGDHAPGAVVFLDLCRNGQTLGFAYLSDPEARQLLHRLRTILGGG